MRYFSIKQDDSYAIQIGGWYSKIDPRHIAIGKSHKLPKRVLLPIKPRLNPAFPDVITSPFFLVTQQARQVIRIYDSAINYKQIVLLSQEDAAAEVYFLPILHQVNVKAEGAQLELQEPAEPRHLFIARSDLKSHVIASLDVVESMLIRNLEGIQLTPVEIGGLH